MKKFDRFLEFLFHTKKGFAALAGSVALSAIMAGGCYADCLSCICAEACGADDCAACWSECETSCYKTCFSSCDCALFDCLFGPGCETDCGACGTLLCGGCNRTVCTECGLTCEGGCGTCSCGIGNFVCDQVYGKSTVSVTWYYRMPDGTWSGGTKVDKKNVPGSLSVSLVSQAPSGSKFDSIDAWLSYFTVQGFYLSSDHESLIAGADGTLKNSGIFSERETSSVSLDAKLSENRRGDVVTISFVNDYPEQFYLNAIKSKIGAQISYFPTEQDVARPGHTFSGWRLAGTNNAPVMFNRNNYFHLYTFLAAADATSITLEPVYDYVAPSQQNPDYGYDYNDPYNGYSFN